MVTSSLVSVFNINMSYQLMVIGGKNVQDVILASCGLNILFHEVVIKEVI